MHGDTCHRGLRDSGRLRLIYFTIVVRYEELGTYNLHPP